MSESSNLQVVRNGPPKSIFGECRAVQAASQNLVVYSAIASQIVTLAWPTFRDTKIKPTGIKDWLRARALHWSCFCQIVAPAGVHLSSQIIEAMSGDVQVFCHYEPATCGFFINLNNIYETTTLTSEYPLLMRSDRQQGTMRRDTAQLINFQLDNLQASEVAPYFRDYCGDMVLGVLQKSGAGSHWHQNTPRSSATTRIRRLPRSSLPNDASTSPQASTSSSSGPSNSTRDNLADQRDILERLAEGEGIDKAEWDGVVETCDVCQKVFVAEVFKAHYRGCWNV